MKSLSICQINISFRFLRFFWHQNLFQFLQCFLFFLIIWQMAIFEEFRYFTMLSNLTFLKNSYMLISYIYLGHKSIILALPFWLLLDHQIKSSSCYMSQNLYFIWIKAIYIWRNSYEIIIILEHQYIIVHVFPESTKSH